MSDAGIESCRVIANDCGITTTTFHKRIYPLDITVVILAQYGSKMYVGRADAKTQ